MSMNIRPTITARVDLNSLSYNLAQIHSLLSPNTSLMAIVKANAYGHGLIPIVSHLISEGIEHFGVARLEEGLAIRDSFSTPEILILSPVHSDNLRIAIINNLSLCLAESHQLEIITRIARQEKLTALIHIKVDTGMHRSGATPDDALDLLKSTRGLPGVETRGVYTHFADADSPDRSFTLSQLKVFTDFLDQLKSLDLLPPLVHSANSAATLTLPQSHFNLVRTGKSLYGHNPFHPLPCPIDLKPCLTLTTHISRIHQVKPGDKVGYGCSFSVDKPMTLATLPIGYADGIRRAPHPWPYALIKGKLAPTVGRISMDQMTVDVSSIQPTPLVEEEATLISSTHPELLPDNLASKIGTIGYEVLTSLNSDRIKYEYLG